MIYLDNAATTFPKPYAVLNASMSAARFHAGNPGRGGHSLARAADAEIYACRKALKEFFNAPSTENVILTHNATASLNICINGLIKPGERVITTDFEHNSVRRPLHRVGAEVTKAETLFDEDDETVERFRGSLAGGVKWLVVCHASNVWGKSIPLKRITALAHEYGAKVIVDASQSAGYLKIDVVNDGIDYLCAPGHKGMYGPQGTGFLIVNSDISPKPLSVGGTGSNSFSLEQPDYLPDALESGTLNVPAAAGLRRGVQFLRSSGVEKLHAYELGLAKRVYDGLKRIKNVSLYTSAPTLSDSPVVSFNVGKLPSFAAAEAYDARGVCLRPGYHCAPDAHTKLGTKDTGTVRLSVGAMNYASEIDSCLEITQKISK
ncbi:MAG: aminotransferase class V-fold PLP-dependent enzyme [Clostridia bacterium]|nr:aminotransferase class V-fold PLP-dependent enzyme [Clostridia bacterium]